MIFVYRKPDLSLFIDAFATVIQWGLGESLVDGHRVARNYTSAGGGNQQEEEATKCNPEEKDIVLNCPSKEPRVPKSSLPD